MITDRDYWNGYKNVENIPLVQISASRSDTLNSMVTQSVATQYVILRQDPVRRELLQYEVSYINPFSSYTAYMIASFHTASSLSARALNLTESLFVFTFPNVLIASSAAMHFAMASL